MNARQRIRYLVRARDVAMTVTGLTMVLTPLALWASPNLTAFYAALLTCGGAYCAYLLLSQFGLHDPETSRQGSPVPAPDRSAAEPARIEPQRPAGGAAVRARPYAGSG